MDFAKALKIVTDEINDTLGRVDSSEVGALAYAIARARRITLTGQGRSGLVARAFAMRLTHLGLSAQVVGETTTAAVGKGDLLVAISCSGSTGITCHIAKKVQAAGATVACLTGAQRSRLARRSNLVVLIPAPAKAEHRKSGNPKQFGSTLFEQCSLIALDALCLMLMKRLKQSHAKMLSRHTNLE